MTTKKPLLLHHGGVKAGLNGTKRAVVYAGVQPSPAYIGLMESAADSIEGVLCILRGEYAEQVVVVIEAGVRATETTKLWIREVNSRIRGMLPELLTQLDGSGQDIVKDALAESSVVRSFGSDDN